MITSPVFDWTCTELEGATTLNALEARGTIRIALKSAGLDAAAVSAEEMSVLLNRVLPQELEAWAVEDAAHLCARLVDRLGRQRFEVALRDSAEAIFARLGSHR